MFARLLDAAPDAPFIETASQSLTRAGFEREVESARRRLQAEQVEAGAIVAWLGHNSVQMLATLLACQRSGSVFLPLNWRLAAAELAHIVKHAGAGHLLGTPELAALAADVIERSPLQPGRADGVQAGDLMLVYTSGTTGRPKGAMHTAAGMRANLAAAIDAQGLDGRTRTLAVLPLFHVGGLCIQTLPTLAAGGVVRLQSRFDAAAWFDDVQDWRASTSLLVPALMRALIEHPRWPRVNLESLHFVTAGSQLVPASLIVAFQVRGVPVVLVYGATETGPVSIVVRPEHAIGGSARAGQPALGVQVKLGDDGEIMLKAPNLMRGYHREAMPSLENGWFRTGDLARQHDDGGFELVGRKTELIISGGENIHPAEIENLVMGWPGVAEAVVVGVPDARWGEVPVLVIEPRPGAQVDVDALMASLDDRLARFKRPRRVVLVAELPRTALGKVHRVAVRTDLNAPD